MRHYFLDTNIIIDLLADRRPFSEAAVLLFDGAERGDLQLYVSPLSFTNIYYILRKVVVPKELVRILRDLAALVTVVPVPGEVVSLALDSGQLDLEDAIQLQTARLHAGIEAIVTRDPSGFKGSPLPVLTPEEALSALRGS